MKVAAFAVALLMFLSASLFLVDIRKVTANQDGDFVYQIDGSPLSATVTGYVGSGGDIAIPTTLGGFPTTAIGTSAFRYTLITSVTMPDSLVTIGQYAFSECGVLNSVVIPNNVTRIEQYGFLSCSALTSLIIGNHVAIIGHNAFSNCTSLTSLVIPDSVTNIGDEAFGYCTGLTSISIGNSVYSIGNAAFSSCTSLTSVTMGSSVTILGYYSFANCRSLTGITIPNSVVSFDNGAFSYCISLNSVILGSSVAAIGDGAFGYCVSLTSISFLGTVAPITVGDYWLANTNVDLRGHALTVSNFPAPGGQFEGLTMGAYVPAPPGVPLQVVATPGNAQAMVNWTAPADNGGSAVTGYRVYRALSAEGSYDLIGTVTGLGLSDTGLANGQTGWYTVSAVNAVGEGNRAGPASITAGTPTAPRAIATSAGLGKITITWQTPASDSGSAVTGYRVFRAQGGVPVLLAALGPTVLEYVDSNGSTGVNYGYYVQAVNSIGPGAATAQSFAASQDNSGVNNALLFGLLIVAVIVILFVVVLLLRRRRRERARAAAKKLENSKAALKKTPKRPHQRPESKQSRKKK